MIQVRFNPFRVNDTTSGPLVEGLSEDSIHFEAGIKEAFVPNQQEWSLNLENPNPVLVETENGQITYFELIHKFLHSPDLITKILMLSNCELSLSDIQLELREQNNSLGELTANEKDLLADMRKIDNLVECGILEKSRDQKRGFQGGRHIINTRNFNHYRINPDVYDQVIQAAIVATQIQEDQDLFNIFPAPSVNVQREYEINHDPVMRRYKTLQVLINSGNGFESVPDILRVIYGSFENDRDKPSHTYYYELLNHGLIEKSENMKSYEINNSIGEIFPEGTHAANMMQIIRGNLIEGQISHQQIKELWCKSYPPNEHNKYNDTPAYVFINALINLLESQTAIAVISGESNMQEGASKVVITQSGIAAFERFNELISDPIAYMNRFGKINSDEISLTLRELCTRTVLDENPHRVRKFEEMPQIFQATIENQVKKIRYRNK